MAVSKRLRYEVLKRDNHLCRYCGRSAPEVKLTIDHVVPTTLGGDDEPANLVTACADCNSGKSSSNPDSAMVADVGEDALRWAQAQRAAAEVMLQDLERRQAARRQFKASWDGWTSGPKQVPVPPPPGWQVSVDQLLAAGLPLLVLEDCVTIAMNAPKVTAGNTFRYLCGVAWKKVRELNDVAASSVTEQRQNPTDPVFPVMHVADQVVMDLCRVLGHSDEVGELATQALWSAAADAHRVFIDAIAAGSTAEEALEDAEEEASSSAAYYLHRAGLAAKEGRS